MRGIRDVRFWAGLAVTLNVAMIAGNVWVRYRARTLRVFPPGQHFPVPTGTTLDGAHVKPPPQDSRPCYLVRFGSEACRYSRHDVAFLAALERDLNERGCVTVLMAPLPDLFPQPIDHRRINLAFVELSFAAQAPFAETPTTIVVDRAGTIRWSKVGSLGGQDAAEALGSLKP